MTATKTILVLAGGIGGIVAARLPRKHLPRGHRVVLVEGERPRVFPAPQIRLRQPGWLLHMGKVAYEKYWLYRWF